METHFSQGPRTLNVVPSPRSGMFSTIDVVFLREIFEGGDVGKIADVFQMKLMREERGK